MKLNDELSLYNFNYKLNNNKDKRKFQPSNKVIKENEELIIDNNQDFLVVNKDAGIAVQGGTKSKKNLIDIFSKSKLFIDTKFKEELLNIWLINVWKKGQGGGIEFLGYLDPIRQLRRHWTVVTIVRTFIKFSRKKIKL